MPAKSALSVFLLLAISARAAELRGRVMDPSGAAVVSATVSLTTRDGRLRLVAVTDSQGSYAFPNLAPGEFLAFAEAPSFLPSATVTVPLNGDASQDFSLGMLRLATRVSVTASATAQSTDEIAKGFDQIDSTEFTRRREFSLVESVRLIPGVRVMQLGGPGSLARIHTRGLRAFDTSLLIDGFRFRDVAAPQGDATGFLADFLLVNADRVEVLRGSGSSLYGTNAIGGVINLAGDTGGGRFHGEASAEGGGLGLARGGLRLAGGAFKDRLAYTAGFTHLNVTRGVDGDDRYRNSSVQSFARLSLSPRTTLTARLFANDAFAGLNVTPSAASPLPAAIPTPAIEGVTFLTSLNDPDSRRASRFFAGGVSVTHQWSAAASLRASYSGLSTFRDNRNGPAGPGFQSRFNTGNRFDGRTGTALARTDLTLARRHLVSAGYEFEREDYDNLSTDENPNPAARTRAQVSVNQASHAVFVQDQWRILADRLQLSLSGRSQHFQLSRPRFEGGNPRYQSGALNAPPNAWTGDAALFYFVPSTGTKLRAHTGNSYRAPTLYERFGYAFFGGSFTAYGDPIIAPERSVAFDAGFDQYLAAQRVRVSGTFFYTRLQQVIGFDFSGLISPRTDPWSRSSGYRNTGGGLARGAELSMQAQLTRRLYVQTAYTYTNADERFSTLLGGPLRSIRVSDHMFTAMVTQRVWRGLDVTLDFFGASNYLWQFFAGGNRPFLFPGPKKADLAASYRHPLGDRRALEFFTRIENFTNRAYYEDGFRTPKAWAVGGMRLVF